MKDQDKVLGLACLLTLLHYTGAYMRVPVLPLYATAHGATPTDVGLIVGASMVVAAVTAIPFGVASDRLGRRTLLLGGTAISALTSLLLPLVSQTTGGRNRRLAQADPGGFHAPPETACMIVITSPAASGRPRLPSQRVLSSLWKQRTCWRNAPLSSKR